MMTNASTTLMWNFLYGFTIQRTARQSKMSRQWMNCQVARVRREVIEKSFIVHCHDNELVNDPHTTTHPHPHPCISCTPTFSHMHATLSHLPLTHSYPHTVTHAPHILTHSHIVTTHTLTVNHTRTLILSHMHLSHSHIQLTLTLPSHHIPAQQILWWNQETHSQPQTAVVSRYPRHCTSGNAAYPSDHMSRHWMLVWLSVGNNNNMSAWFPHTHASAC